MQNEKNDKKSTMDTWWQKGLQLFLRLNSWIVFPIIIAIVVGKYLDKIFGTSPWLISISIVIAFVISMIMLTRIGLKEMDK
jgi:F0F1-type ATP synthase assembly protein I